MSEKVLFVDDEQSLLNGLERRLSCDLDMDTALSGDDGLLKMEESGPYAVVVTDMQMPQMNGVQFIKQARMISPETVYIMLTGNQDQTTATQAVNNGEVYRFLNKPCDFETIKRCVTSAQRQYDLARNEKELLQSTMVGTIRVLSEVLEVSQPDVFSQEPTIEGTFQHLTKSLSLRDHWEYKLVFAVGFGRIRSCCPNDNGRFLSRHRSLRMNLRKSTSSSPCLEGVCSRIFLVLGGVARIIECQSEVNGDLTYGPDKEHINMGANILKTSIHWSALRSSGLSSSDALRELQRVMPELSLDLTDGLMRMSNKEGNPVVALEPRKLREGMIVADDVVSDGDERLVRAGRHLTTAMIEKLTMYHETQRPIKAVYVYETN